MTAEALKARTPSEPGTPLQRGVDALVRMQRSDGSWEAECVWCPMLTAQYAIAMHVMGVEVSEERRRGLLAHFRATQNQGLWGLHPFDEGSLFVTTLVYVAARLLGASPRERWLQEAQLLFEREGGVQRIPTWGKVWLALVGLYGWDGVQPILPEIWKLPSWVPVHPANYYCHTRLIYMGLAVLYGERITAPTTPVTEALRRELYCADYASINFRPFADQVREADAPFPATARLKSLFRLARGYEHLRLAPLRKSVLRDLRARMRVDLRASSYLSLSPVNGLLTVLALAAENREDQDVARALERFEAWFWEDDREGSRVAGAGSVCWDSSFALQALAAVPEADEATSSAVVRGTGFLASQQIEDVDFDHRAAYRIDPRGGWCFSEIGHGWPVSDCTAEAMLGLLHNDAREPGREGIAKAVRFILRCQNRDGGFGSYEPQKTPFPLEWMNPAEMFGRCMTERSYVECTASCLMALCEAQRQYPDLLRHRVAKSIERARGFLLKAQNTDGSWDAAWGVRYIYATMFGVRGLLAAGVDRSDVRIRNACRWLLEHQRSDGGWGERQPKTLSPGYLDAGESLPIQTAWALITLVEARETNSLALRRAAAYLESSQLESGEWRDGQFVGVFFETALLNYRLYRQYFPVMALALHARASATHAPQGRHHVRTATPSPNRA